MREILSTNQNSCTKAGPFGLLLLGLILAQFTAPSMAQAPDLIVFNGKIATVDEDMTFVEAMAIRDDTLVSLGSNEDILRLAGPQTKRVDVKGRTVLPGIVDPHRHLGGFRAEDFPEVKGIRVPPSQDKEEITRGIIEAIQKRAQEVKPGEWIIINPMGWAARELILYEEITRADLDRWAPGHAIMLNENGTGAYSQILFSSKAREIIEDELPVFAQFSDNDIKGDGVNLVNIIVKDILLKGRDKEYAESIKHYLINAAPPRGITTVGTRILRTPLNALFILDKKDEMPLRFGWFFSDGSYYNPAGFYKRFPNFVGVGSKYVWGLGNGEEVVESPTTGLCTTLPIINPALREHYRKAGIELCRLLHPVIRATVKDQIAYGRGVEYHGAGDRTIDLLLEIIEEVQQENNLTDEDIREKRLTMEHLALVRPDQYPKLKKYGIIMANTPGYFARNIDKSKAANIPQNFGEEYLKWHQPAKSFIDYGIMTVMSEIGRPFVALKRYITRETCFTARLPEQGEVGVEKCAIFAPEQAVDRNTALRMATIWPAYYMVRENEIGSLEEGKWADFIGIDQDYFSLPEKQIADIQVLLTVLGGEVVYANPDFGPVDPDLFRSPDYIQDAVLTN